ncbi:hypothetical protein Tco_0083662 [Tanacetum coccineum]
MALAALTLVSAALSQTLLKISPDAGSTSRKIKEGTKEPVKEDDDEDVGAEADMNNLDAFMPVSPIPTTRIHKDHPVETNRED